MTGRTALARQNAIEAEVLPPHGFWSQADVLAQERGRLGLDEDPGGRKETTQPSALCLSGGGIRSAAFCLGVLQALARDSLLQQFHYLSTVSGGGYIGGWLTRCIAENQGNIGLVERSVLRTTGETEPDEIGQLRRYVNYLTPHPGLLSADTWAGVTLWIRNTLINWAVFLPIMMAVMAVPVVYVSVLVCAAGSGAWKAVVWGCFGLAGLVFLTVAVFHSCAGLPSHDHEDPPARGRKSQLGLSAVQVWLRIIVPALIWSVLVPVSQAPWLGSPDAGARWEAFFSSGDESAAPAGGLWPAEMVGEVAANGRAVPARVPVPVGTAATAQSSWDWMAGLAAGSPAWQSLLLPLASFGAGLLGFLLAWRKLLGDDYVRSFAGATTTDYRWEHSKAFLYNSPAWVFSCALSAGLLYLGIRLAAGQSVVVVAIVGPLWVIASDVIRITAYVAVRRDGLRSELDREWLARVSGLKLRTALGLGLLMVLATVLPRAVLDHRDATGKAIYGAITFFSGGVGAWLGSSIRTAFLPAAKDGAPARFPTVGLLGGASLLVFLLCALMLIGRLDVLVVRALEPLMALAGPWGTSAMAHGVACLCLGAAGVSLGFWLGTVINLNLFSLHAVYRNRLVRAFLGSARKRRQRHPDRFTSFDPEDDVRVSDTFDNRSVKRLYPVINVALNRTTGSDTARAARKAEPFVITPYHCGSSFLDDRNGAYVNTRRFAGREKLSGPDDKMRGITLGSAIALSGAAVSPNRGYNSSPLTAFVMTLFNLRLGAWLPNPVRAGLSDGFSRRSGPGNAVPSMLKELTGRSDDQDKFVYLSDGGHFDNLGLYSMLQRRCGRILVVDAGRDQSYGYDTLGQALEHARVDMGVKVTFIGPLKVGATALDPHGAHAQIEYGDGSAGELVYIKPWVPDDAPAELRAYGRVNAHFPHDTTVDQFFAERDFESYRHLGEHLAGVLIEDAMDAGTPPVRSGAWTRLLGGCRARPADSAPSGLERLFTGVRILSGAMPPRSAATPVLLAAKRSVSNKSLPKARALKALMWADKGDLEQSHRLIAQHEGDPICDLVRAHLHRRRGEARKARYWYRRSGRCYAHLPIDEELETLARQLLVS